jgi:GNAT superfamily N-acetyltransferase
MGFIAMRMDVWVYKCWGYLRINRREFVVPLQMGENIYRECQIDQVMIQIKKIDSEKDIQIAQQLLREYGELRCYDIALGDYETEMSGLPGEYAEPKGCFLLAFHENDPVGCVALRRRDDEVSEMKRLYVKPDYRGRKIGRALVVEVITEAKRKGYRLMRLDTHPWMKEAEALYKSVGFYEIEAYRFNPIEGVKFFELELKSQ